MSGRKLFDYEIRDIAQDLARGRVTRGELCKKLEVAKANLADLDSRRDLQRRKITDHMLLSEAETIVVEMREGEGLYVVIFQRRPCANHERENIIERVLPVIQ